MTGSRRSLFAVTPLFFVFAALLWAQDAPTPRLDNPALSLAETAPVRTASVIRLPTLALAQPRDPIRRGIGDSPEVIGPAGIIFSGAVISVDRSGASSGQAAAATVITFRVDHAIRGTSVGQILAIHEWAGLWANGERYRVGENVLLFLYSPSKCGLTSPVAGPLGRFAVDAQGRVVMNPHNSQTFAGDPLIGRKTVVPYTDFAQAVQRSGGKN